MWRLNPISISSNLNWLRFCVTAAGLLIIVPLCFRCLYCSWLKRFLCHVTRSVKPISCWLVMIINHQGGSLRSSDWKMDITSLFPHLVYCVSLGPVGLCRTTSNRTTVVHDCVHITLMSLCTIQAYDCIFCGHVYSNNACKCVSRLSLIELFLLSDCHGFQMPDYQRTLPSSSDDSSVTGQTG